MLDVNVEPGELTDPNSAQPLVILSDTSSIHVRAYVEELDAPRVTVGMPATVTADGLAGKQFAGHVVSISPRMDAKCIHADRPGELYDTKVREVLVELDTESPLIVGLRVDVTFETTQTPSTNIGEPLSSINLDATGLGNSPPCIDRALANRGSPEGAWARKP